MRRSLPVAPAYVLTCPILIMFASLSRLAAEPDGPIWHAREQLADRAAHRAGDQHPAHVAPRAGSPDGEPRRIAGHEHVRPERGAHAYLRRPRDHDGRHLVVVGMVLQDAEHEAARGHVAHDIVPGAPDERELAGPQIPAR